MGKHLTRMDTTSISTIPLHNIEHQLQLILLNRIQQFLLDYSKRWCHPEKENGICLDLFLSFASLNLCFVFSVS